jgi:hypothetical protein
MPKPGQHRMVLPIQQKMTANVKRFTRDIAIW